MFKNDGFIITTKTSSFFVLSPFDELLIAIFVYYFVKQLLFLFNKTFFIWYETFKFTYRTVVCLICNSIYFCE